MSKATQAIWCVAIPGGIRLFLLIILMLLSGSAFFPSSVQCGQTIKLASIYANSGSAAGANSASIRGVRLAVTEINEGGGVFGKPLEIVEFNDHSSAIGSKVAAVDAVNQGVVAIIGAAYSTHSIAIAKVAQKNSVPMITNVSTNPVVTRIGDYIFRVCFNDWFQGEVMAGFAREQLKAERVVAVFNVASDYSIGLANTFERAFVAGGGTMLAKIPYKIQQPNFRKIIVEAKSVRPDAIFIPGHYESARIVVEALKSKLNAVPLGGDGWDSERFYNSGGNRISLGYYTTHWNQDIETPRSKAFVQRHRESDTILAATALAYDAVLLLVDAMKRAGTTDRTGIRTALARTRGFQGVSGTISFDTHGDPVKSVVIMKIEKGRPVYLKQIDPG